MAVFRPFRALRPKKELALQVAALPYDVMNTREAREMAQGNPYSFLHVDRAEIDLEPGVNPYDERVYARAAHNLGQMVEQGVYLQEEKPCYYIYRQVMDGRSQMGMVGCASIEDYLNDHVKKHELTRADKEADRIRHVDACDANTGPIFLTYREQKEVTAIMTDWVKRHDPIYDFTAEDGISHTVWLVDEDAVIQRLSEAFEQAGDFYIADGHHRAASAVRVGERRRASHPGYTGEEEFNYFLAVLFPDTQLKILDYNRVVHDLNGHSAESFLKELEKYFTVRKAASASCRPEKLHSMGMYLQGVWYLIEALEGTYDKEDPVKSLDVSILQENVLAPVLGIEDPRTSERITFVGGIRGLEELMRLADEKKGVAFAMYPTSLGELMRIADTGNIMPPKSTWFEPKLRSGIFLHKLS